MATLAYRTRPQSERIFFTGLALAIFAAVFLGFARSFYLRAYFPEIAAPDEAYFYFHGALYTAWFVLLVTQPLLIATGGVRLHQRLGWAGAGLAALMVAAGIYAGILAAQRPTGFVGVPMPADQFLIVPLADMILFALFVALAVVERRRPQSHKRLMMLASISLLGAAFARWPIPGLIEMGPLFMLAPLIFVGALALWDRRSRGALHRATLWGGLLIAVSIPMRLALAGTPAWLAVSHWMTGTG